MKKNEIKYINQNTEHISFVYMTYINVSCIYKVSKPQFHWRMLT